MRDVATILNETYKGLELFVRDLFLEKEKGDLYQKGNLVTDPSFIDMTYKIGGMKEGHNTRFVILSNRSTDMQELETDTSWGLYVIHTHAYFKVLDTFAIEGKQIIVLLHIKEEDKQFFLENEISYDEQFIAKIKKQMGHVFSEPVVADLDDDFWDRRVNFPIGLKEDNTFFQEGESC